MSTGLIDLRKKVDIVLTKRKLLNVTSQVALAIDISGSMQGLYARGVVQAVVDRLLAVAMRFDDNGSMDMWCFDDGVQALAPVSEKDFGNYVQREILNNSDVDKWGGTAYSPVINDILSHYYPARKTSFFGKLFGRKAEENNVATPPALVIFITDGDNIDKAETTALLEEAQAKNIYFQFVGIGDPNMFGYLSRIADRYPNTGFVAVSDISRISDDDLYEKLITDELATWLGQNSASK